MREAMGFPQLFWLAQKFDDRHVDLHQMIRSVLPEEAANLIAAGDYSKALEELDGRRNRIWSQLLLLSTPVSDLRAVDPHLADELERISQIVKLAAIALSKHYVWDPDPERSAIADQYIGEFNQREAEYFDVLDRVQEVPGFEKYREAKSFAEISRAAEDGPVVVINMDRVRYDAEYRSRCDALILTRPNSPVTHVPLPKFSYMLADKLHDSLVSCLHQYRVRSREAGLEHGGSSRGAIRPIHNRMRSILACLWTYVVHPILQAIEQTLWELSKKRIPHVTWCPTGSLAFLPLHAAGIYSSSSSLSVSDFVVSSYTPTLSMLVDARSRALANPRAAELPSVLIVSQPNTPGHSPLPGSFKESAIVKAHFPHAQHLNGADATTARVQQSLQHHPWVHFACHGIQDSHDPMRSAFALHDGMLALSALMREPFDRADLAFLSACQTATGDHMLPDESAHLAGGMLAAGYASVVATMWSIGDRDAPVVADEFYAQVVKRSSELFVGEEHIGSDRAYMLHAAVKRLREEVGDMQFVQWVPFVLFGL